VLDARNRRAEGEGRGVDDTQDGGGERRAGGDRLLQGVRVVQAAADPVDQRRWLLERIDDHACIVELDLGEMFLHDQEQVGEFRRWRALHRRVVFGFGAVHAG
jgi:hypothetical protein